MARRTHPSFYGTDGVATGNIGETKNRGYELELGWQERVSTDFEYNIRLGTSYSENRVVFRDDPRLLADYLKHAGKPIGWQSRLVAGGNYSSLDDIYNAPNTKHGMAQGNLVPGDLMVVVTNGDGKTDGKEKGAKEKRQ